MLLLGWLLLGALIGMAAAQKKGFSLAGGVIGGAALGPIGAWLLYLVSGIVPGDQKKRCVHCQSLIPAAARVCAHCRREQPAVGRAASA
ncbi:MAG TPA: hypothetical protein PK570_00930 [Thermoanaerobaculia bacterium]|nr:hypothetical protein [Thermoanaerobaculia bacterium]